MKTIFSGILLFALLVVSMFAGASSIQSTKANASSRADNVQAAGTDWWPMFHHDLNHTGASTTTAPTTNNTLWTYMTGGWVWSSAVVNGFVYVGSNDTKVYCLNAITGSFVWSYKTGGFVLSCPAVVGGFVYVGSADGKVYCLNAATGSFVWSYTTGSWDARFNAVYSSPAVVGGLVYIGSNDGAIFCLNATTGAFLWGPITLGSIISSPAVAGGRVYVGSTDGWIYCKNATTGSHVWYYQTGGAVYSSPAVAGGLVYVGSADGKIYCLNATTGAYVWSYTTGNIVDSSPAVVSGFVYVGSYDRKVYCLNAATGSFVWSYTTSSTVWGSSPAVVDGRVYVGSNDTKVYCLNAATGSFVWSYKTGGLPGNPAVVNAVYVGSRDGRVYAFGTPVAVSISPASVAMDVGQSKLFTSIISSGTSPYSYQWYLNGAPVSGATSATWTFTPPSADSYTIYLNVTDAVGVFATSNIATTTVHGALSASISPSSATLDVGQSKLFTTTISNGTTPYTNQWYLNNVAVSGATSPTWTFKANSTGSYSVYVNTTDNVSFRAKSNVASVTVNPSLSATLSPSSIVMDIGQSQLFNSSISGGTPSYSYQWYLNGTPVSGANSHRWTFTPTSSGPYTIYLNVTDSAGAIAISPTSNVTVNPAIPEFPPLLFLSLFIMATLLAVTCYRRKRPQT